MIFYNGIFEIIKKKYDYLNYSDEKIKKILMKIFDLYAKKNITDEEQLIEKTIALFNKHVVQLLNKEQISIVLNYIKLNVNFKNKDNLSGLVQIANFFEELNYHPNVEQWKWIINNNNKLYDYLSTIINVDKKSISKMDIDSLSDNDLVCLIIEVFCRLNDVVINDNIEELKKALPLNNSLKLYLLEINQYKMLTPEEEYNLFLKYKNGDEKSKNIIINSNLRLVIWIVKKFLGRGYDFLDLIQEGNIALIKAIENFDVEKGNRFSTYAKEYIYQFVKRSLCNNYQTIRIPVNMNDTVNRVKKIKGQLQQVLDREPTKEEVAYEAELPISKINMIYKLFVFEPVSLNTLIDDTNDTELLQLIGDVNYDLENDIITKCDFEALVMLLKNSELKDKEFKVIYYRFGLDGNGPRTLSQIGQLLKLSRERVRNIQNKALDKLRCMPKVEALSIYLDDPYKVLQYAKIKS